LVDGFLAPLQLLVSIFHSRNVFDVCAQSWWYNCAFLLSFATIVWVGARRKSVGVAFLMSLIALIIMGVFANIAYVILFVATCTLAGLAYNYGFKRPLE
jgi:Na+-translocating ferredoxin:NAD+ oxidoreductase RnfD subunit